MLYYNHMNPQDLQQLDNRDEFSVEDTKAALGTSNYIIQELLRAHHIQPGDTEESMGDPQMGMEGAGEPQMGMNEQSTMMPPEEGMAGQEMAPEGMSEEPEEPEEQEDPNEMMRQHVAESEARIMEAIKGLEESLNDKSSTKDLEKIRKSIQDIIGEDDDDYEEKPKKSPKSTRPSTRKTKADSIED